MSLIIAENITHAYGAVEILRNVSFRLAGADRVGIVGPNGQGKTTLLRIVGGMLEQTGGEIHRRRDLRIGYLPQDPPALGDMTVHSAMLDVFADLRALETRIGELAHAMADDPGQGDKYSAAQHEFETQGGYDYPRRIEQVLEGLAFPQDMWDRPLDQLSGGQRTRAYLATLLLKDPDVLMLDEPTNHLDIDCIEWLEGWLRSFRGALMVVSHDRYFLDSITTDTWEVAFATLETYRGAYSQYLPKRTARYAERLSEWESQQEYIAKTQDFIARNLAGQRTKEAQGRRTRLLRFIRDEAITKPQVPPDIHLSIPAGPRTGDMVLRASDLTVGYTADEPLVTIEQLNVQRGDRIAVVGGNGVGKTTLVRTILGQLAPLGGEVEFGSKVRPGYVSQTHDELSDETTALDAVRTAGKGCPPERARGILGSLLISGEDAYKKINELSGGQRSRIVMGRLTVVEANLLIMDEPTNHLDIASAEIMQEVLQKFDGTIMFVSHDRYLVQSVATHIWAMDGGQVRTILGGWNAYLAWRAQRREQAAAQTPRTIEKGDKAARAADYRDARKQANLLQRLQRRHTELEDEIDAAEKALAQLNGDISTAGEAGDMAKIEELGATYQETDARLKTLWAEWEDVGLQLEN